MKIQRYGCKRIVALLCIILILVYTSVVFLPHSHDECIDAECAVCLFIESSRNLLVAIALVWMACRLNVIISTITNSFFDNLSSREYTLVGLKVKLSD